MGLRNLSLKSGLTQAHIRIGRFTILNVMNNPKDWIDPIMVPLLIGKLKLVFSIMPRTLLEKIKSFSWVSGTSDYHVCELVEF